MDGNVHSYAGDPFNPGYLYVLRADRNLWYESIGWQQNGRSWVDGNIQSLAPDTSNAGYFFVLGRDSNLWWEQIG